MNYFFYVIGYPVYINNLTMYDTSIDFKTDVLVIVTFSNKNSYRNNSFKNLITK